MSDANGQCGHPCVPDTCVICDNKRLRRELAEAKAHHMEALRIHIDYQKELRRERDNAARNERIRWAERAEALAAWNSEHPGYTAEHALEALAAELRAEGGGT